MKQSLQHWKEEEIKELEQAQTFEHLRDVALRIVQRMPGPIGQVCGPIATGGRGSIEKNLEIFEFAIDKLVAEGKIIFNQMPFEPHMQRLVKRGPTYSYELLETFYLPIFSSGKIKTVYFLPDWMSSTGAKWEYVKSIEHGLERVFLEPGFLAEFRQ